MQADYGEEERVARFCWLLCCFLDERLPLRERAEMVADVRYSCRLDAREDGSSPASGRSWRSGCYCFGCSGIGPSS